MILFRLLLIFLAGLFIRRVWRVFKGLTGAQAKKPVSGSERRSDPSSFKDKSGNAARNEITEQEIDDADFEEIS